MTEYGRAMELRDLSQRAAQIRQQYAGLEQARYGRAWTDTEIALGFVGDVGDLMKLVTAKSGVRDIPDVDSKLAHELADCFWSVLVLAEQYDIDLEQAFVRTMDELEERIAAQQH